MAELHGAQHACSSTRLIPWGTIIDDIFIFGAKVQQKLHIRKNFRNYCKINRLSEAR
jgi:hypothetical protein